MTNPKLLLDEPMECLAPIIVHELMRVIGDRIPSLLNRRRRSSRLAASPVTRFSRIA